MEVPLILLLYMIGIAASLCSAILTYISNDEINSLIEKNYKKAQSLQYMQSEHDETLNPLLVIETGIYISASVFLGYYMYEFGFGFVNVIAMILVTALILMFSRTIVYAFGAVSADSIGPAMTPLIKLYFYLGFPLYWVFSVMHDKIRGKSTSDESRDEISALVESAHEEGLIEAGEYRILKNIMNFSEVYVTDVMTPRTVMFSFDADKTVDDVVHLPEIQMYSRFPIWEGESFDDGVLGYVMSKDILLAALKGKGATKLRDFCREVYFIPENAELDTTLEKFLNRRQHLFVVVDEYGGVEGLISMEDVVETMLGVEIVDEVDKVVDLRLLAKQRRDNRIASKF
jgi:CBS domain containing-hemolysin-like protein